MSRLASVRNALVIVLCTGIALFCVSLILTHTLSTPRNDRDWSQDQMILPFAVFEGDLVTIHNIRNFSYRGETNYTPSYYDKTYDLGKLVSVDYIVEPLARFGIAHTLLSFGFSNGEYISLSVEIRKEKGESFSPLKGLFDQYELMYVIADERDVIKLRALHRKDPLYLYKGLATKEEVRALFVSMLTRANTLKNNPEFYNTLTSTCTTNIVDHVNAVSPKSIPWSISLVLPKGSDKYAYRLGLIDTSLPFSELKAQSNINARVEKYADHPNFSMMIREYQKDHGLE